MALEIPDRPGGLAKVLEVVERANVNVEYVYAFTSKENGHGLVVFRFDQPQAALIALQRERLRVVGMEDLRQRLKAPGAAP
jgi:hypothetical protein